MAPTGACRPWSFSSPTRSRSIRAPKNSKGGNPRGRPFRCGYSSSVGGRRRSIGVVAVLPLTTARPRRWCDAGPPKVGQKAGAAGSRSRKNPPGYRRVQLSLGCAKPTAATLMVGPAPPYVATGGPEGRCCGIQSIPATRWERCQTSFRDETIARHRAPVFSMTWWIDRSHRAPECPRKWTLSDLANQPILEVTPAEQTLRPRSRRLARPLLFQQPRRSS